MRGVGSRFFSSSSSSSLHSTLFFSRRSYHPLQTLSGSRGHAFVHKQFRLIQFLPCLCWWFFTSSSSSLDSVRMSFPRRSSEKKKMQGCRACIFQHLECEVDFQATLLSTPTPYISWPSNLSLLPPHTRPSSFRTLTIQGK